MNPVLVSEMVEIACRAITARHAEMVVQSSQKHLDQAYKEWKEENGVDAVERYTTQWDGLMEGTRSTYENLVKAKRTHYNAKRRLDSAIAKMDKR